MRYVLALALLLGGAIAHGTPVASLVLACPDNAAIDQAFDSCRGYVYQIPTNQLIVVSGPSYVWHRASDLAGSDTLSVCTLPVEPGQYSSCRDATGARRTAFVRKDTVIASGGVTVSKTGGDYTDPVTAAANAFSGDTWCVAPQWPAQPCVMAIGEGVFILHQTLSIPAGLVVAGAGKGATMLVADNGVETAVTSFGNVRISDLTIVNSQLGGARTTGLNADAPPVPAALTQLHDVAIHVAGAAQNVAVLRNNSLEILDSEITAVGQDATGISGGSGPDVPTDVTLERSRVSAETALNERSGNFGTLRLVDSQVSGAVSFDRESSLLEIVRSGIVGNVTAHNDWVRVAISDSSITGIVNTYTSGNGAASVLITDTNVEGNVVWGHASNTTFDGLTVHGELVLYGGLARVLRSYIVNSASTAAALSLRETANVELEQTFVEGALALAAEAQSPAPSLLKCVGGPCLRCCQCGAHVHGYLGRRLRVAERIVSAASAVGPTN